MRPGERRHADRADFVAQDDVNEADLPLGAEQLRRHGLEHRPHRAVRTDLSVPVGEKALGVVGKHLELVGAQYIAELVLVRGGRIDEHPAAGIDLDGLQPVACFPCGVERLGDSFSVDELARIILPRTAILHAVGKRFSGRRIDRRLTSFFAHFDLTPNKLDQNWTEKAKKAGGPKGIRTPVTAVKGQFPPNRARKIARLPAEVD